MRPSGERTRRRIIEAAYALFYAKGFARVSMAEVALRARVTKRTLYVHFGSKDGLLTAALDFSHELALSRIRGWFDRLTGDTDSMIDSLFSDFARWAATPGWMGTGMTRLSMELADMAGHPGHAIARRHKAAVEAAFTHEFARRGVPDADARARDVVLLLEGTNALLLVHRDPAYAEAAARAAQALVKGTLSAATHRKRRRAGGAGAVSATS